MGWQNPAIPWSQLEKSLSWGRHGEAEQLRTTGWARHKPSESDLLRGPIVPVEGPRVPWAELHTHSYFSFLDGASSPAELAVEAVRLGVEVLGVTDHDGFYGAQQFHRAVKELRAAGHELKSVFGAELSLGLEAPRAGAPDPSGRHLLVLARNTDGYRRLSRAIGEAQLAGGEKGRPVYDLDTLTDVAGGDWAVLTGCRKGAVRAALDRHGLGADGERAAEAELRALVERFGRANVFVELIDQDLPTDDATNALLATLAERRGLPTVASNNAHYAGPDGYRLATALGALRARRELDTMDGWSAAAATAHLRSGAEMTERMRLFPGVVARTAELGAACAIDFATIAPKLPDYPVPAGHTEMSWLRHLTLTGAADRYGPRDATDDRTRRAYHQLAAELEIIEKRNLAGYFLIVHEITEYCRREENILCQGRGSAANSAVCFALRITNVDPIEFDLVFERFLSLEREGYPDIDVDIEAKKREKVIQHVYQRYGRNRAAQVANVITYRPKLALRDAARAFGYGTGTQDAWVRRIGPHEPLPHGDDEIPAQVLDIAHQMLKLPRHLGIHSGGMVIVDRPIAEVCPTEWARMADRSVLQWEKDDCAQADLVKFDLLGLGMLGCIHDTFDLVHAHYPESERHGFAFDNVPQDPSVYDMLCAADAIGVFQVESRAQLATLPRLKPRTFYDLVVEVSLIRPGPIQGGAVHPYLRRRDGFEAPDPPHHTLENALKRTLGVVLFQEQCLQIARDCAGLSPGEANELRRAMTSKRSAERIQALRAQLMAGMRKNGIPEDTAEEIYGKLEAFSGYGFPESHSISMAYLVWCSAYQKRYFPAAFTASLLNNQPMGFYSPATLIGDARRHQVPVRQIDVNASGELATLESPTDRERADYRPTHPYASPYPQPAIRLGLGMVRGLGADAARLIVATRDDRDGPGRYRDLPDFVRRTRLPVRVLEALAAANAFACFGLTRRQALWAVGALADTTDEQLPLDPIGVTSPPLPAMTAVEETFADLWATSVSPNSHPVQHIRGELAAAGILTVAQLGDADLRDGQLVRVAGLVTHRQRPPTAGGTCFLSLEDETGTVNVVCPARVWEHQRRTALEHAALIVRGTVERISKLSATEERSPGDKPASRAVNMLAVRLEPLRVAAVVRSRDFH
jgi:error-prone DNA polymerase